MFSPKGIEQKSKRIALYAAQRNRDIDKDLRGLGAQLQGVQVEINNIVDAIAKGMFQRAMKERMDALETRQADLIIRIEEAELHSSTLALPVD